MHLVLLKTDQNANANIYYLIKKLDYPQKQSFKRQIKYFQKLLKFYFFNIKNHKFYLK